MLLLLLSSLFLSRLLALQYAEGTPEFEITALNDLVIGLKDEFMFSCIIEDSSVGVSLLIDNSLNSSKLHRITTTPLDDRVNGFVYKYSGAIPSDNGTVFSCIATNDSLHKRFRSDNLTLEVQYAPIFAPANNQTVYHFIKTGDDGKLNCSIAMANPPVKHFHTVNDSKDLSNVKFSASSGTIVFTKAKVDNRGSFTCIASNAMGTTHLTYKTFVGGPPNGLSVTLDTSSSNGSFYVAVGINDTSDAPAQQIRVALSTSINKTVTFTTDEGLDLPVRDTCIEVFELDLNNFYYANYTISITAINELGSQSAYDDISVFINGTRLLHSHAISDMANVTEGTDFIFYCLVPSEELVANFTFSILIDQRTYGHKYNRLIPGRYDGNSQFFALRNLTFHDDRSTFTCVVNSVYHSNYVYMRMFYTPVISGSNGNSTGPPIYFRLNTNVSSWCYILDANPPLLKNMTVKLDVVNASNIINETEYLEAVFYINNVTYDNKGTYTCSATNIIGTSSKTWVAFVGEGGPDNVTIDIYQSQLNGSLLVAMGINDYSPAPATILIVELLGQQTSYVHIDLPYLPARNQYRQVMEIELEQMYAGNYTLNVTGYNPLGMTGGLSLTTFFVAGTYPIPVNLVAVQHVVIEGDKYYFSCVANTTQTNVTLVFDVFVNDQPNHSRLIRGNSSTYSQNFTFLQTSYKDDQTRFVCVMNNMYKSKDTTLTVFYRPRVSIPSKWGAFVNDSLMINVTVQKANPPDYRITWLKNGKQIAPSSGIIIEGNSIHFKTLTVEDTANYSVLVDNGVLEGTTQTFEMFAYDGPFFNEGRSNVTTLFTEKETAKDFRLTCSVNHSVPAVTELSWNRPNGTNWHTEVNNKTKSVSLVFSKAVVANNSGRFTCYAKNSLTTASLSFDNYVGGPPNRVYVNVTKSDNGSVIRLSLNISDKSDAPITEIKYYLKDVDTSNSSKALHPPFNDTSIIFENVVEKSYYELGGSGMTNYLYIYTKNMIGESLVLEYNFTLPGSLPSDHKLRVKKIAIYGAGPLAFVLIVLVLIILASVACYRKWRRRRDYVRIPEDDNTGINHSNIDS